MITIYVDMDDVLCDFTGARREALLKCPEMCYPQSQLDFFRKLKPMPGAIEGFKFLRSKYDTAIATAPSMYNPLSYTEKALWVQDTFGFEVLNDLIEITKKDRLIGDYLIDDRTNTNGQDKFKGKLIHFGSAEFPNWDAIVKYFTDLK
jgi:5'-nucleotidase